MVEIPIFIIGRENLQNNLFRDYITHRFVSRCFLCPNFSSCVQKVGDCECPPVFLMDIKNDALEEVEITLKRNSFQCYLILFNLFPEEDLNKDLIEKGLRVFFFETDSLENILKGICTVSKGEIWFPRGILQKLVLQKGPDKKGTSKKEILSLREKEILALVADGLANPEIADRLCISSNTARTHVYNIFKKIGVSSRYKAASWVSKNS